jgi:hypothetical protein
MSCNAWIFISLCGVNMEPMIWVIATRAVERLLVILVGALAVWVGYRLFMALPERREGESKLDLPGGVSIFMSRIGPGIFFALFGTGLIAYAATKPVSYQDDRGSLGETSKALAAADSAPANRMYSGLVAAQGGSGASGSPAPPTMDIAEVIRGLNIAQAQAETLTPNSLRLDATSALREAKLALMHMNWDANKWGDYDAFHAWVTEGFAADPVPPQVAAAAAVFRRGGD